MPFHSDIMFNEAASTARAAAMAAVLVAVLMGRRLVKPKRHA